MIMIPDEDVERLVSKAAAGEFHASGDANGTLQISARSFDGLLMKAAGTAKQAAATQGWLTSSSSAEEMAEAVFQAVKVYVQRHTAAVVEAATKPLLECDKRKGETIRQLQAENRQMRRELALIKEEKRL